MPEFWAMLESLDKPIRESAHKAFKILKEDPNARNLKMLKGSTNAVSARINQNNRALGFRFDDSIVWVFAGDHNAYDRFSHDQKKLVRSAANAKKYLQSKCFDHGTPKTHNPTRPRTSVPHNSTRTTKTNTLKQAS